ncbi:hypothetical protein ACHAWF_001174 [Thalassiosira exigua]
MYIYHAFGHLEALKLEKNYQCTPYRRNQYASPTVHSERKLELSHGGIFHLVKAYDTANHKLLTKVLIKYGAPPKLCSVIEQLYADLKVVFKMGAIRAEIKQGVGVQQGDKTAPVLFLFLMTTFSELLKKTWEVERIERVRVYRESKNTFHKGQLFWHDMITCRRSKTFEEVTIDNVIYADDEALSFGSRELQEGMTLAQQLLAVPGLEMHVGRRPL